MSMIAINKDTFNEEVLNHKGLVLVDFWATWCGPCNMLSPIVFDVSKEREDVKFCTVDVDQNQDLLAEYGIMSVPTLIVFKNGEIINKSVGVISKPEILALLD